jgi:hypothetical protein
MTAVLEGQLAGRKTAVNQSMPHVYQTSMLVSVDGGWRLSSTSSFASFSRSPVIGSEHVFKKKPRGGEARDCVCVILCLQHLCFCSDVQIIIAIEHRLRSHENGKSPAGPRFFLHHSAYDSLAFHAAKRELVNSLPWIPDARRLVTTLKPISHAACWHRPIAKQS